MLIVWGGKEQVEKKGNNKTLTIIIIPKLFSLILIVFFKWAYFLVYFTWKLEFWWKLHRNEKRSKYS